MKKLEELLAFYRAYHSTPACRAMHFIGVPLVTFSILIPMGWLAIPVSGHRLSLALAFVVGTLGYYWTLDRLLAVLVASCMVPITWGAAWASALPLGQSAMVFGATFVLGWVFQIVGHIYEGRRPALLDNFAAVFTAPLFLMAEISTRLGWRNYR